MRPRHFDKRTGLERRANRAYLFRMPVYARLRLILLFALSFSMASLGFAHKSHAIAYTPDLVVYLSNGGSLDEICGAEGGEAASTHCEACRLADDAFVNERNGAQAQRQLWRGFAPTDAVALHGGGAPKHKSARAPPEFS